MSDDINTTAPTPGLDGTEPIVEDKENKKESKNLSMEILRPAFFELYKDEPFLGYVAMHTSKRADNSVPTAYMSARVNGKTNELVMGFNLDFMDELTKIYKKGVIKHEIYHLVFKHVTTRITQNAQHKLLWGWATDLAINCLIGKNNLPEFCLYPGREPKPPPGTPAAKKWRPTPYSEYIKNAPENMSSDYYFNELRKIQTAAGDRDLSIGLNAGFGSMDDHSGWGSLPKEVEDQIRDKIQDVLGKAAKEANSRHWGSVPKSMQKYINSLVSKEVNWVTIVKQFLGKTRSLRRISTIRRINKKQPYKHPGVKRPRVAKFACFVDQSGSVSDKDLELFFGEIKSFAEEVELDVYHFDTEVDEASHTVWKKGSAIPKTTRTKTGGTNFNCVSKFCNKTGNKGTWSGVVILTDGFASRMSRISGAKTLWVITEKGSMQAAQPGDLVVQMKKNRNFRKY